MKKLIAFIIFALMFSGSLYSQSSWEKKIINSTLNLTKVIFLNSQTGYICGNPINPGDTGYIFKTTNSGDNWFSVYKRLNLGNNLTFINPDIGYVTFKFNSNPPTFIINKTIDGGISWQYAHSNQGGYYNLYFNDYAGWYSSLYKSIDNGTTWQYIPIVGFYVEEVFFVDYFRGFYWSSGNYIFKTSNSGLNWYQISAINYIVTDMYFLDSLNGYLSGKSGTNTGGILKTTNGGLNWNFVFNSSEPMKKIISPTNNVAYALGDSIRIFRTSNAGNNWSAQNLDSAYRYNDLSFANAYTGFVVGQRGIVMRTTNGGSTFINPISTEIPSKYSLSQNYPNPFNSSSNLKFQIVNTGDVKLIVYDIMGKEVQTLVNERLQPGTYEAAFDARHGGSSSLNSGVYFYKLVTDGFSETKKMILIK